MWRHVNVFIISILCWGYILSDDCVTPSGRNSKCVSLYDCPALASVTKLKPLPDYLRSFLKQSLCGFQGINIPKVCCGPVPDQKPDVRLTAVSDKDGNGYSVEDSLPASRGQCGVDRDGDRIYGGKVAEFGDFPWMALIGYKNSHGVMNYKCGGSLINQRYVLTAAHCVIGYREEEYGPVTSVRLGEHDMSAEAKLDCPFVHCQDRRQEIPVASTHAHPGYIIKDRSRTHDIAIVRLAKRATYTYYVQPICLVNSDELPTASESAMVAGWGETLVGPRSNIKLKLKIPIFNKDTCTKMYQSRGISLNSKQFCAGGTFKQDACGGDSGGPLMMKSSKDKWETVGVISFGRGCGLDGWPGIYTSVGGYLDWIKKTLQSTNH